MIDRHNYEEYLLLYVDGELSATERTMVEQFLELHPDLAAELQILQETVLAPTPVVFPGKSDLYRQPEGITTANYEEFFLLYVDNELDENGRAAVETFVLQHPETQNSFTALKAAVLPQEWVVYPDKQSLYRKEEKRRPVNIYMRWAALAAAVLTGVVALVTFNQQNNPDAVAVTPVETSRPAVGTGGSTTPGVEVPVNRNQPVIAAKTITVQPTNTVTNGETKDKPTRTSAPENQYVAAQEQREAVAITTPVQTVTSTTITSPDYTPIAGETKVIPVVTSTSAPTEEYVQPAVYQTTDTDEDNKGSLYVGALQVNPDKVRGFLRKASRFLSSKVRNNDGDDDEKVKVANMEVKRI